jgi:hypothetical protein
MRHLRAVLARIAGLFIGNRADNDMRDELQAHLDMETAENIRRGMPPEEARRQALLASGGLTRAAEAVRDRRGLPWIEASRPISTTPSAPAPQSCSSPRSW